MVKCNHCLVKSRTMPESIEWNSEVSQVVRKFALQNAIEYHGEGQSGSVLGRVLSEREDLRSKAKSLIPLVNSEVSRANLIAKEKGMEEVRFELESFAPEALDREKQQKTVGLKDLPGETDDVVLRFAPNPNGPLSLGHSRGVVINSMYSERYDGKIVLRFDDTDTRVKPAIIEAYDWIEEEFEWLSGRPPDVVVRASERMPLYIEMAEKMISGGFGYVCLCSADEFREFRISKEECPCRDRDVSANLEDWGKMNSGGINEGEAVVRVRTDMTLPNPALRDWPALRIQHAPHPIVGDKYKVWPLLDFQSAVEDHAQGVTHIIRGKDLMDSTRKQTLLYEHFDWNYPETMYWGRVKVHEFGGFSTSGILSSIKSEDFSGWDDPRLPTIKALRNRGFSPESIRLLWEEIGLTQKDISISMATLESFNSKVIDSDCERRVFVIDPIEIDFSSDNRPDVASIPRHPEGSIQGNRKWEFAESIFIQSSDHNPGKVRLKDFADVEISEFSANIESLDRTDDRQIIHWLPKNLSREAIITVPDGENLNRIRGFIEDFELEEGRVYQFERFGFAKIDSIDDRLVSLLWLHN